MRRLSRIGLDRPFMKTALLPEWWDADCAKDVGLLPEIEFAVARFLGADIEAVRDPEVVLRLPELAAVQLRHSARATRERLLPSMHAAHRIAGAVTRNLRDAPPACVPPHAAAWREELLSKWTYADLNVIVGDLWARGIPVVHLSSLPAPKFQGMACLINGRPIVLLGQGHDQPARHLFYLVHEAGHLSNGDCDDGSVVVDEDDGGGGRSPREVKADEYGLTVLNGRPAPHDIHGWGGQELAEQALRMSEKFRVDPGHVVLTWGKTHQDHVLEGAALKAMGRSHGAKALLGEHFAKHVDVDGASQTDGALLRCVTGGAGVEAAAD